MTNLVQANRQWSSRPADERFTSLHEMHEYMVGIRQNSRATIVSSRVLNVVPSEDNKGIEVTGPNGHAYAPTNWAFGQLAQLAEAPAGYLRTLPSPIAADALNFGLRYKRGPEDVGVLLYRNGSPILRAATGPAYGRIWNSDIVSSLIDHVGDGITGYWRVPGEFGRAVEVSKDNTTLYASDRDMFVFLADEQRRIEMPARRNGKPGSLARGFFLWNSETGKSTFGIGTFLFDYVCSNRIVWGAQQYKQLTIRHTAKAPDRWLEEVKPALLSYASSSEDSVLDTVKAAQAKRLDDVDTFLAERFGKRLSSTLMAVHEAEEGKPIETIWDATTAVTAYARQLPHQDARVELETKGGDLLKLVA